MKKTYVSDERVDMVGDEQEEDLRIDLISDEELAACYSLDEVGQRLRAMVHEHFANRTL